MYFFVPEADLQEIKIMSLGEFEILGQLGKGQFSTVYKVRRHEDEHIYALKKFLLNTLPPKEINNAMNEVRLLASIRHSNIIGYRQAFYDQSQKALCIVMEYADGGDLLQKINNARNKGQYFEEPYIWDLFGQIIKGLSKLHEMGIVHRDIKSSNIFLTKNSVKLGDLNISKVIRRNSMCQTQAGTPYYASPEVWRDEMYDSKSDMWSVGCVLYEIINLKLPFRSRDMQGLYKKISRAYYPRINKSYSEQFNEILKNLIRQNPQERFSCRDLLELSQLKKHFKKHRQTESHERSTLLKTIKITKNINYLTDKLPKPNYSPVRQKCHSYQNSPTNKINKSLFIHERNRDKEKSKLPSLTQIRDLHKLQMEEKKNRSLKIIPKNKGAKILEPYIVVNRYNERRAKAYF